MINSLKNKDIAIIAYAETKIERRSGRSTYDVAAEATEMTAYEDFVVEQVRAGQSIIGLYPATQEENLTKFTEWRRKNGR